MDLKTLILAEDRLSTELGDIFGGTSAIDPEINCNKDGVVYPSQPTEQEPENCHMVLQGYYCTDLTDSIDSI